MAQSMIRKANQESTQKRLFEQKEDKHPKDNKPHLPPSGSNSKTAIPPTLPSSKLKSTAPSPSGRSTTPESPIRARDFESYKEKKNKILNFEMNIKSEVDAQAKQVEQIKEKRDKLLKENDDIVKGQLSAQNEAMQEKLRQRRERSFHKSMTRENIKEKEPVKPGESVFKKEKEETEDTANSGDLASNILKLLDDIGPDKTTSPTSFSPEAKVKNL